MIRNTQCVFQALVRRSRGVSTGLSKAEESTSQPTKSKKIPDEISVEQPIHPSYLTRTIGFHHRIWSSILLKHPELKNLKRKDLEKTVEMLRTLNFTDDDIVKKPMILYSNALTLENRYSVLLESGFEMITVPALFKYITIMNKTITLLKSHNYIHFDTNVVERLKNCFIDIELHIPADSRYNENMELKMLRQQFLSHYFRQRLNMTDNDIEKQWKVYSRVRHKSFKSVQAVVQLLLDELQFPKERITKNGYLLYGDAENARRIITEIPAIDGHDMREIVYRRPKILMSSCESLLKTLEHVKSFGIHEGAVLRCLEVLTLGPDTVLERLRDLNEVEEFKVLCSNPRVLRLVHYQNKARMRLEYLNQLKVRCASLHILSCGSEAFAKFAREGADRTKGRDIVVFLANIMVRDETSIRSLLSRHPNWCHIPVIQVKQCYEFLLSKRFPVDSIYHNIHLLLYPIKRIEEKLYQLQSPEFLEEAQLPIINIYDLSNNEILTLVLYLIEAEFHFTGDGIWSDQHAQQVENFNNLLPDFPEGLNKIYKYGVKPAARHRTENLRMQN